MASIIRFDKSSTLVLQSSSSQDIDMLYSIPAYSNGLNLFSPGNVASNILEKLSLR